MIKNNSSDRLLTLEELIDLIDGTTRRSDDGTGMSNTFRHSASGSCTPEQAARFVSIESEFYPELGRWYDEEGREWAEEMRDLFFTVV